MPSMIAHWRAASSSTPSAAATAHASASAASRRGAPRAIVAERADRAAGGDRRGGEHRQPRRLLPEHRALVVADDDLDPGNGERREPLGELRGLQLVRGGADPRGRARLLDDHARLRRRRGHVADRPCRDGGSVRARPSTRARIAATCSRPFWSGRIDRPVERLGSHPIESRVEVVRLDGDDEQRDRRLEPRHGLETRMRSSPRPARVAGPARRSRRPCARSRRRARRFARRRGRRSRRDRARRSAPSREAPGRRRGSRTASPSRRRAPRPPPPSSPSPTA